MNRIPQEILSLAGSSDSSIRRTRKLGSHDVQYPICRSRRGNIAHAKTNQPLAHSKRLHAEFLPSHCVPYKVLSDLSQTLEYLPKHTATKNIDYHRPPALSVSLAPVFKVMISTHRNRNSCRRKNLFSLHSRSCFSSACPSVVFMIRCHSTIRDGFSF